MNDQHALRLAAVASAVALAGCAAQPVMTSQHDLSQPGLVYALPKAQIQLEAVRKVVTDDDVAAAQKDVDAKNAAFEAAKKSLVEATAASAVAQSNVDAMRADETAEVKDQLESKRLLAIIQRRARTTDVETAKLLAGEAAKRLAKAQANLGKLEQTVTLKALSAVPDHNARYVLKINKSAWRDDVIKLSVTNGLLNSSNSETTGQAGAILVNLASSLSALRGAGTSPQLSTFGLWNKNLELAETCKPFSLTRVFDPSNFTEVEQVKKALSDASQKSLKLVRPELKEVEAVKTRDTDGLVYRAPMSVTVEVQTTTDGPCDNSNPTGYASLSATVPDSRSIQSLSVDGSSFTKSKVDLAFKDGMPISFNYDQPSQGVAITRIPIDILKAIVEVPASILKLRVDYDSQAEALIKGQTQQLKAQVDLLKAQQALQEAQEAASKATP